MPNFDPQLEALQGAGGDSQDQPLSFHARLLDSIFDGVYFVNAERQIRYWNRASEHLTGYSSAEAVGRHCYDNFLVHVDETGCCLCKEGCPLASTIHDGQRREADVSLRHKLGHRVPVCVRVAPITDIYGQIIGAVEVFSDVTGRKRVERRMHELETMAFRDSLTGLPNRRYMELKVSQALEEARQFGRSFGVLMLDIDHFKEVNDLHGHDAGDAVLKTVSETLLKGLRPDDLVGRWGGEEFLMVLADVSAPVLYDIAERCRGLVAESGALVGNLRVAVTMSAGGTVVAHEDSGHAAIRRADQLLYVSKSCASNRTTIG